MKPIEIKIIDIKGYRRKFAGRIDAIYLDGEIHIKNISGQVMKAIKAVGL